MPLTNTRCRPIPRATYGNGLDLRPTSLPDQPQTNRGVFCTTQFADGDIITEYIGEHISRAQACALRSQGRFSHMKSVSYDEVIDGEPNPQLGQGLAQMVNDGRQSFTGDITRNNCRFYKRYDHRTARDRVYVQAIKEILPGEELFASYGDQYWYLMNIYR